MSRVANYSIPRNLFEVYVTDEENFVPYEPNMGEKEEESSEKNNDNEEENSDEEEEEEDSLTEGFTLHQGEILEIHYYAKFFDTNYDYDYEDMSNNGSVSLPSVNKNLYYKGVRTCLKKTWEARGETTELEDFSEVLLGFITEQSYSEKGVDLTLSGMSKLLDTKYQFDFSQMKMSTILEEMIKTAGLKPVVDFTGMLDEVIDYSNVSKSEDDEGGDFDGNVSGDVAEMAKKVCKGKKGAEAKAEAIHHFIATHVQYPSPNYSDHKKCASQVLTSGISNCCDRANLGYQMANVVKLKARGVHGPNHVWVQYQINGSWVDSDPGESRQHLHDGVYNGMSMDSLWDFKENGAC